MFGFCVTLAINLQGTGEQRWQKQCYPVTVGRRSSLGRYDPGGGWAVAFEIRQFGDPVLRSKAAPDALFDDSLRHLTEGMLNTLLRAGGRAALAANQVGRLKRVSLRRWKAR